MNEERKESRGRECTTKRTRIPFELFTPAQEINIHANSSYNKSNNRNNAEAISVRYEVTMGQSLRMCPERGRAQKLEQRKYSFKHTSHGQHAAAHISMAIILTNEWHACRS